MEDSDQKLVPLGRISGVFGLQGWVKVYSDTDPMEGIVDYPEWILIRDGQQQTIKVEKGKRHGKGVIARLQGVEDRDAAELLKGRTIAVRRKDLPKLADDEYYWSDLVGMQVRTVEGTELGKVDYLFATGANDVMVVQGDRERLVPWIRNDVIRCVDLAVRMIEVDWDPDF